MSNFEPALETGDYVSKLETWHPYLTVPAHVVIKTMLKFLEKPHLVHVALPDFPVTRLSHSNVNLNFLRYISVQRISNRTNKYLIFSRFEFQVCRTICFPHLIFSFF
jgi:hypothetical protein